MEGNYFIRCIGEKKKQPNSRGNYIALPFQVAFNFRYFSQCYWAEAESGQQGKLTNEYTKKTQ